MKIISHRGYWKELSEKNKQFAFERSFSSRFGTETDLRDYKEDIVISHDIPNENCITIHDFFNIYNHYSGCLPLALNIKADGLQVKLIDALQKFAIHEYFVFDMSIPDTIGYIDQGIRFFSRQSEYELEPAFYDKCDGIWLDSFNGNWYAMSLIQNHIKKNKKVAIVSPELHKRDKMPLWEMLKKEGISKMEEVILCTDIPEDAVHYFN